MSYHSRISKAFQKAPAIPFTKDSKFILISDCHRGGGNRADGFLKNQQLYLSALQHYYKKGYSYIELGDGDDLWKNRKMNRIAKIHRDVFSLLSLFHMENRLHLLFGNHDIYKKSKRYKRRHFPHSQQQRNRLDEQLFSDMTFHEGLILENDKKQASLYLTHGHQAVLRNSVFWKCSRFLVYYLLHPLERLGLEDPNHGTNLHKRSKTEIRLRDWAKKENRILITGHTHRPRLNEQDDSDCYFNTGSCVRGDCITCIEVENFQLSLVKWSFEKGRDGKLIARREVLAERTGLMKKTTAAWA